jgi:predicted O-methyltransferase YrrM
MRLDEALRQIAQDGGLNADELIAFAAEDKVGGRDTGHWSGMSTFEAEGQILYALIRSLRPERLLEVGVDSGGTTTHILSALEANGAGHLDSVDIKAEVGIGVPESLRHRWTLHTGDALTIALPDQADFIFEDGEHSYDFTFNVLARLKDLNPRMILSHDALTHLTYGGFDVLRAFTDALGSDRTVLTDGSIAGLAYWFNSEYQPPAEKGAKRSKGGKHA